MVDFHQILAVLLDDRRRKELPLHLYVFFFHAFLRLPDELFLALGQLLLVYGLESLHSFVVMNHAFLLAVLQSIVAGWRDHLCLRVTKSTRTHSIDVTVFELIMIIAFAFSLGNANLVPRVIDRVSTHRDE